MMFARYQELTEQEHDTWDMCEWRTVPSAAKFIENFLINSSMMLGIKSPAAAQDGGVSVLAH